MAEPSPEDVATSSTPAGRPSDSAVDDASTANTTAPASLTDSAATSSRASQETVTAPGFLAVNSRAAAQNGPVASKGATATQDRPPREPPPSRKDTTPSPVTAAAAAAAAVQDAPSRPDASRTRDTSPSLPNGAEVAMTDAPAATYGTRSRNRTGNPRPNYAEDQQDVEFESAATTVSYKKKLAAEASTAAERLNANGGAAAGAANPNARDSSGASVTTTTSNTKKRKSAGAAAGGGGAITQSSAATSSAPPATNGSLRKAAATAAAAAAAAAASSTSTLTARETSLMTFRGHKNRLNKHGELVADDGTKLRANDHVYLVCEPPGDPYYLCRIMEFLHVDSDNPASPVDSIRVNWYYRPRDVQRFNNDTRLVYATMHSDMCPITSLRGKCEIKHRSEIDDLDEYRKRPNAFYFVQVFDRFIRRWYECIPTSQIINVPEKVKKALDERWKFVAVELGRVKELTSAVKTCKRCAKYCASHDSVDCAICKNSYHMNCVQPPLPKKPSRGFAWACGPCGRAAERKMEAQNTPTLSQTNTDAEEEEVPEEEDVQLVSSESTRAPSPDEDDIVIDDHPATQAEIKLAQMWPMRYLGIHCRVEDALQYDDRAIYPRASSRLGPRHQANTQVWHGRPVELVKPAEVRKKYVKSAGPKKEGKLSKETVAALEADRAEKAKRPKWVQDAPSGYVARGEDLPNDSPDNTAKMMFQMPDENHKAILASRLTPDEFVNDYVKRAKNLARTVGVPPFGINFIDKALELLTAADYDVDIALKRLSKIDRRHDLHEPVLSKDQLAKFEEGVAKYGSEHRLIRLHMKTNLPNADIVRFYYLWKKTPKGREIWGSFGGRKGTKRKLENDAAARVQAEVAHDVDDSAFDNDKAARHKRGFQCKFCNTRHARQWRRAPGVSAGQTVVVDVKNGPKEKKEKVLLALCLRCAGLWRRYAIQWEDVEEMQKKLGSAGAKAWKRRIDEELLRELVAANESANASPAPEVVGVVPSVEPGEPPKKKSRIEASQTPAVEMPPKKKEKPQPPPPPPKEPTPPPPPIIPAQPEWRELPCTVCKAVGGTLECQHCKLTVHRRCFGLSEKDGVRANGEVHWVCEQCQNDRDPLVSTDYSCTLCLTEETYTELVEPPRVSHKKKNDREKEKERLEKELADGMRADYRSKQLGHNRPPMPREPLKRTAGNNWVHVYCAVWTPEIKFSTAAKLEIAEGIQLIPPAKHEAVCKLCKNKDQQGKLRTDKGSCVTCQQHGCGAFFHVSCAFDAGYQFGFDITPVKNSRKDQIQTIQLGEEAGLAVAAIWCKDHVVKTIIHPMNEVVDESGTTALQRFVEKYKQADLTWTGTARKANLAQQTKEKAQQIGMPAPSIDRRASTTTGIAAAIKRGARASIVEVKGEDADPTSPLSDSVGSVMERRCNKCKIDVTPRWHMVDKPIAQAPPVRPPSRRRRMSMTLAEIADSDRQRSPTISRTEQRVDISGAPLTPSDNNRSMEQISQRSAVNGDGHPADQSRQPNQANGEPRPSVEDGPRAENDDGYHNHALPRYQNPATASTPSAPPTPELVSLDIGQERLCHKCFIKRKNDPTPPPPSPQPPRRELTPPTRFPPPQLGWQTNGVPHPHVPFEQHHRLSWDDPHRQSLSAQPSMNGYPPPPHHQGYPPQAPPPPPPPPPPAGAPGYSPYGQPNGYHSGPPPGALPPHVQGPPPSHHHELAGGFQYRHHQPSPHQAPFIPATHHVPPPGLPPHPVYQPPQGPYRGALPPNGMASSSPHQPPPASLQSPPYVPATARPPYAPFQAHRTESPFSANTLPPIGAPTHSLTENPAVTSAPVPPSQAEQQQQRGEQPGAGAVNGSAQTSPQPAPARPESRAGLPATPQNRGTPIPGPGGASASPNVRNLVN